MLTWFNLAWDLDLCDSKMAAIEKEMLFISRYFIITDWINQNGTIFDILSTSEWLTVLILAVDHTQKGLIRYLNRTSRLLLRSVNEILAGLIRRGLTTFKTWWWHNPLLYRVFLYDKVLKRLPVSTLFTCKCPISWLYPSVIKNNSPVQVTYWILTGK